MASRSKKDANDAIESLGDYLSRDRAAVSKLETISKYVGELRREKSAQAGRIARLQEQLSSQSEKISQLESRVAELREELSAESSRRRQAEYAAATDSERLQSVVDKLSPPKCNDLNIDERKIGSLIDVVTRQMPLSPHPAPVLIKGQNCAIFEISDFIKDMSDIEFTLLGKFVLMFLILNAAPVAFEFDKVLGRRFRDMGKKFRDSKHTKLVRWIDEWMERGPEYKNRLYDAQLAAEKVVSGEYIEMPTGMPDNFYDRRSKSGK